MKEPIIIPVDHLNQEPYSSLLCFPSPSETESRSRLEELKRHGVTALEFSGTNSLFGVPLPILGKGFVGIVAIGHLNGERVAIKIRRVDSDRSDLFHEAKMLFKANSVNVGPKLVAGSKNFLLMQLIIGNVLPNWLKTTKDTSAARRVLSEILEQCFRLDQIELDHGELSKAPKHLLVDIEEQVYIVDFETASAERRPANVTAVCQYLFAGNSSASKSLTEILGEIKMSDLIVALRAYKNERNRNNFEKLFEVCVTR